MEAQDLNAALDSLYEAGAHVSNAEETCADPFEYSSLRSMIDSAQREVRRLLKQLP